MQISQFQFASLPFIKSCEIDLFKNIFLFLKIIVAAIAQRATVKTEYQAIVSTPVTIGPKTSWLPVKPACVNVAKKILRV